MHFSKDSKLSSKYQTSQWHHIGLFGLMEFSAPVNLERICPKDSWQAVRVRTGILQGLIQRFPFPRGGSRNIGGINIPNTVSIALLYSPEEVSVSCKK